MKQFNYVVKDAMGIHARPAGVLAKEAKNFSSKITIHAGDKQADMTRIMAIMALGVKAGQEITIAVEGADEDAATAAMKKLFEENL